MKIRNKPNDEKVEIQMTPMIDIVFQLLVFFIMTFNVVAVEGDFSIRMPALGPPSDQMLQPDLRLLKIKMDAVTTGKNKGQLAKLTLIEGAKEKVLFPVEGKSSTVRQAFSSLHTEILKKIDDAGGPDEAGEVMEVEFSCDYNLKYNNVIEAITAVSGKKAKDSGKIQPLIEKIKFAAPRNKPG